MTALKTGALVDAAINRMHNVSLRDIAVKLGMKNASYLSMIRTGKYPIPLGRLFDFASVLNIDPAVLLRAYIEDPNGTDKAAVLRKALVDCNVFIMSAEERKMLDVVRANVPNLGSMTVDEAREVGEKIGTVFQKC